MAAHRYWGLLILARAGSGNGVGVAEVEMRASAGGADQCTGGAASGASSFGQVAANAFDNDAATIWHNAGTGGDAIRLSYDFGTPVSVAEVFVRNVAATGSGTGFPGSTYGPGMCWVVWSDDGTSWELTDAVANLTALGNAEAATIAVTDAVPGAAAAGGSISFGTGWPAGAPSARPVGGFIRHDTVDGGPYRVAGTVAIDGTPTTPVRRRVRLFHRLSGRLVREVWSAEDGAFEFTKIAAGEYVVMSDDYTRTYNAVVADAVMAVP